MESREPELRDGLLRLSFHPGIEDARFPVGADRAHEKKMVGARSERGFREVNDVFVVHLPERRLGAGLLHRRAEAAEHVLHAREGRHPAEPLVIDGPLLEPLVHHVERPADERDDVLVQAAREEAAKAVPAHETAGACHDGRASRHDVAPRL